MEQSQPGWTQRVLGRATSQPEAPSREPEPSVPAPPKPAVVEPDCALEGKLVVDRSIRIEGELRGSVVSADTVWVTETGTVEGDISARIVEIRGAVVGNVTGAREVLLHDGGKLHGDVDTSSFVVERGAYFSGRTNMRLPQHASRDTAPSLPL